MEKIKCPSCGKEKRQNKHERNKTGSIRYLCKSCNKTYIVDSKGREYSKEAMKLYMEENSGRAVGKILDKKYAKKIEEKTYSNERVKVIEMDEL